MQQAGAYLGVDLSAAELAAARSRHPGVLVALARADRLPVAGWPGIRELRLLAPMFWRLRSLPEWPQRITGRGLRGSVTGLPLRLESFRRRRFKWVIDNAATARRLVEGLYLPDVPAARIESATRYAVGRAGDSPTVPVHLARVVLIRDR